MIQDICLHGQVGEHYEFYTTIVGSNLSVRFFYEEKADSAESYDRFFSGGNEIRLYPDRLVHYGTGGSMCPYMYAIDRPVKDVLKRDVRNRLVIYGVRYGDTEEHLSFTTETDATETYERLFREGHALTNYFFFIAGDIQGGVRSAQEVILRLVGKFLKRYDLSQDKTGAKLARELYQELGIPKWTLFLMRLTDRRAEHYAQVFRDMQRTGKPIKTLDRSRLDQLAQENGISWEQQERLEICVLSDMAENQDIISQYEETLVTYYTHNISEKSALPRLNRLRALATRRHLPTQIFDRLDKSLQRREEPTATEPTYVAEVRRLLQSLFIDGAPEPVTELFVKLMELKQQAVENRSLLFEKALDELSQDLESWQKQSGNEAAIEAFHTIIGHFDRFDMVSAVLNSVAFIDEYGLTEERLFALARNCLIFENIQKGLFNQLFFDPLLRNRYLNTYGRQRLLAIQHGVNELVNGETTPKAVIDSIAAINHHFRLRRAIEGHVRQIVRSIHKAPLDKNEQAFLRNTVNRQLEQDGLIQEPIPDELFASVLIALREEGLYLQELLPRIIESQDRQLRDDFLENSGLDRFRIEEMEQKYLKEKNLPANTLDFLAGD